MAWGETPQVRGTRFVPLGNTIQARPHQMRLIAFLVSIALSGAAFITLDWFYSAAILRAARQKLAAKSPLSAMPQGGPSNCRVPDPVRHHALQPNCASIERWGRESYELCTNNLGFRDERIRDVPLADSRPRILILGDSFTEGKSAWRESYVGRIAAHFPQYDFLNGGVESYSPSNYLNLARMILAKGVEFDEVIVFIDISDTQDEAAYYRDVNSSGAVTGPEQERFVTNRYSKSRLWISKRLLLTNYVFEFFERKIVRQGHYHLTVGQGGNIFDLERSAWTYRKVSDTDPFDAGYAPLGVEGGIVREKAKMTLLWQELAKQHIPISIVVYPWPAQIVHDTGDSRQVGIWRDWCEGKCQRFLSLFPVFLAVKAQCPRNEPGCWYLSHFIFGDLHYSSAGNALVANAIIKSFEAAPPTKAPNFGAEPGPSTRDGVPGIAAHR